MVMKIVKAVLLLVCIALTWRFGCLSYFHIWAGSFAKDAQRTFHVNHAIWFSVLTVALFAVSIWILVMLYKGAAGSGNGGDIVE